MQILLLTQNFKILILTILPGLR